MPKLSEIENFQIENLRYYPAFVLVTVILAIVLCRVTFVAAERTLLPRLYPVQPAAVPLRVTNNDGTLSNGDKLRGWPFCVFFVTTITFWMVACVVTTVALIRIWPVRRS
jgi:hypothetical protein